MAPRNWTRAELLLAMNLYCRLPFGKLDRKTPEVIALATAIGRTASSVGMKLCNLASLDPAHQARGIKGLSGASNADRAIWAEFHADWATLVEESAAYESELLNREQLPSDHPRPVLRERVARNEPGEGVPALPTDLAIALRSAADTEAIRSVKVRTAQDFFRRAVLASYRTTCCISGIALPELLVASHILPWGQFPDRRVDPRNGLCLSRLHDTAFDRGLITFDADLRLVLSCELRDQVTNSVLSASFTHFAGQPLRLPDKFQPERENLRRHREEVFRG